MEFLVQMDNFHSPMEDKEKSHERNAYNLEMCTWTKTIIIIYIYIHLPMPHNPEEHDSAGSYLK